MSEREIRSTPVNFAADIFYCWQAIAMWWVFDEAQFFDESIVEVL